MTNTSFNKESAEQYQFGCTKEDLLKETKKSINFWSQCNTTDETVYNLVISMLNDAQERLNPNQDASRQLLNRAKFILSMHRDKEL